MIRQSSKLFVTSILYYAKNCYFATRTSDLVCYITQWTHNYHCVTQYFDQDNLFIETLIRKAKIVKSNTYELFEIPFDFLVLVNSNIIDSNSNLFKSNKCL